MNSPAALDQADDVTGTSQVAGSARAWPWPVAKSTTNVRSAMMIMMIMTMGFITKLMMHIYIYVYMYGSRLWLKRCVVVLSCAFSCSVLHWAMAHGSDDDIIMGNRDGSPGDSSEDAIMGNLEVAAARPKRVRARKALETIRIFWCLISTAVGNISFSGQLGSEASAMPGSFVKGVARCSWRLPNPGDTAGVEVIGNSIRGAVMYSVEEFFSFVADFPLASLGAVQGVTSICLLEGVLTDMALEADRCCYSFLSRKGVTELILWFQLHYWHR